MKNILLLGSISILFLLSCKSVFLKKDFISSLTLPDTDRNVIVYSNTNYRLENSGRAFVDRHTLLRLGKDTKTLPDVFYEYDGSVEKLKSFDVRIIHPNGAVKTFGKSDCVLAHLSNARMISTLSVYYLPVLDELRMGDLVEIVSTHENTMPLLGITFSPSEAGDYVFNASCSIETGLHDSLFFRVENDSISPEIILTPESKTYHFHWTSYTTSETERVFGKKNVAPTLLAQILRHYTNSSDHEGIANWKDFGDAYLDLISFRLHPDKATSLAREITQGKETDKEKMDAIADYCQKNIRYEQVYIERGEFIPNDFTDIIAHKYGDCKDYSLAIYLLAKSIGLNANLALCYRGRGMEFYPEMPVSQFNHMIAFYSDNGKNFWYDGTNRSGIPGEVDLSLMNQTALVLEKGNSRLVQISESDNDLLSISGKLQEKNKALSGDLTISLRAQYAIDFLFRDFYLNEKDMRDFLYTWLRKNIHENIVLRRLNWQSQINQFEIYAACDLPNTVVSIDPYFYVSGSRLLPALFPCGIKTIENEDLFYFPFYSRVQIDLEISDLSLYDEAAGQPSDQPFHLFYPYTLPPGPFTNQGREQFIDDFKSISEKLNTNFKLMRRKIL